MTWYKYYRLADPNKDDRLNYFKLDLRSSLKLFNNLTEVIFYNIDLLKKHHPGPYTLFFSGGADSQVMLYSWLISNENFNVVHYSYNGLNDHETELAIRFCKKFKIDLTILNFNAIDFITSDELERYAKLYDCISPQILTHIKLIENHKETVIFAGNYIKKFYTGINYTIHGLSRFSIQTKNNFVPFFLMYTPELGYAFTETDGKMSRSIMNETLKSNEFLTRVLTYKELNFPIIEQPEKTTGFEKIKILFDSHKVDSRLRIQFKNMPSKRPFDLLYRYNLYNKIGYYLEDTNFLINKSDILKEYPPL